MFVPEVSFEKDGRICSDLVISIAANIHDQSQHDSLLVDSRLATLGYERDEKSIAEFASSECALTIDECLNFFDGNELYICEVNLANNLIEDFNPTFLQNFIFIEFICHDLHC